MVGNTFQRVSGIRKDYLVSNLQVQIAMLQDVLFNVEHSGLLEEEYIGESLRELEQNVRLLRKVYMHN